ncbi:calcium-binding protein [Oceaniglobus roseus]|uniref:calcium-binding protein n=1 Tax=Oceaniglobus roseus TaxID=1737570 RepID=UPI000C7EA7EF|nr:calcium-binding protein [Kandeliimicrobium roseum]
MAVFNRAFTFDGVTDLSIPQYRTSVNWDGGFASWVSFFEPTPANTHNLTINLVGADWYMQTLRFSGDSTMNVTLRDLDSDAERRIQFVDLGDNAIVDLSRTRIDVLRGFGHDYDISYGATNSDLVRLGGDGDRSLTLADGGRISTVQMDGGTSTIDLQGSSRVFLMKLDFSVNNVTTGSGNLESFYAYESRNTLHFGTGGVSQVTLSGDGGLQRITSDGYLGALQIYDDNRAIVVLNDFAGSIRTSSGNDRIFTSLGVDSIVTRDGNDVVNSGDGYIGFVSTGNGNDIVRFGAEGIGLTQGGNDDDKFIIDTMVADGGGRISGGNGTDELNFQRLGTAAVEFTLESTGFQQVGLGFLAVNSIERITTANGDDDIIGNFRDNRIVLNGGKDRANGGDGDDDILGGGGSDTLNGGGGEDRLLGGDANDFLNGGAGDDILIGEAGSDRFIFTIDSGTDIVIDFTTTGGESDRLVLDQQLWAGTKTAAEVVADHAFVASNGAVVLDFGSEGRLILSDYGTLQGLAGQIDFL